MGLLTYNEALQLRSIDMTEFEARLQAKRDKAIAAAEKTCGDGCRGCAWCRRNTLRGVLDRHSANSDEIACSATTKGAGHEG